MITRVTIYRMNLAIVLVSSIIRTSVRRTCTISLIQEQWMVWFLFKPIFYKRFKSGFFTFIFTKIGFFSNSIHVTGPSICARISDVFVFICTIYQPRGVDCTIWTILLLGEYFIARTNKFLIRYRFLNLNRFGLFRTTASK